MPVRAGGGTYENAAEQGLRPAVIARKVSCGNKTEAGKRSFEVLRSVVSTCSKRGHDVVSYLAGLLPIDARAAPIPPAGREPTRRLIRKPTRMYGLGTELLR